ncbi:MAG: hypothetical protein ACYC5O_21195 [Anaerolineae bacterium]
MRAVAVALVVLTLAAALLAPAGVALAQGSDGSENCSWGDGHMGTQGDSGWGSGHLAHHSNSAGGVGDGETMHERMMGDSTGHMAGHEAMHDTMIAAFAERIDLDVSTLEARLEAGDTMWEVGRAQGLTDEQITQAMNEARDVALDEAVAQGTLTAKQAEAMRRHAMDADGCHSGGPAGETAGQGQAGYGQRLRGVFDRLVTAWAEATPW